MQKSLVTVLLFLSTISMLGHPGHQDPIYAELNDYLMAIQVMRYEDQRAAMIFESWKDLREASWRIRELTDEHDLMINSTRVMDQIAITRKKQKELLQQCHEYFADLVLNDRAIGVELGPQIVVDWDDAPLEVQVQHSKVVLIELHNTEDSAVLLNMRGEANDQILFWNKQLVLEPNSIRYTYLICSPLTTTLAANELSLLDDRGNNKKITIRLRGLPLAQSPHLLTPGETITKVVIPGGGPYSPSVESKF